MTASRAPTRPNAPEPCVPTLERRPARPARQSISSSAAAGEPALQLRARGHAGVLAGGPWPPAVSGCCAAVSFGAASRTAQCQQPHRSRESVGCRGLPRPAHSPPKHTAWLEASAAVSTAGARQIRFALACLSPAKPNGPAHVPPAPATPHAPNRPHARLDPRAFTLIPALRPLPAYNYRLAALTSPPSRTHRRPALSLLAMASTTDPAPPSRSRSRRPTSSPSGSPAVAPTYGYHNTFHTHAQLPIGAPPTYARAVDPSTLRYLDQRTQAEQDYARDVALPPAYDCSVEFEGVVGIKQELSSPFKVASQREWYDAYVILRGTQLSIHRVKTPCLLSKNRKPGPGRLMKTYSLQHAEVGVASDFKKTSLTPKSPFAHLMPASSRAKLYETDPSLFETVREHAIRLRLELEQFLLCAHTQEGMLSWIEALCAAIDISAPLEDRCEPRYRSLPRRSRRQRALDGAQLGENLENLSALEAGRRIIAQQEQIIRQLYPHLADTDAQDPAGTTTTTITAAPATPAAEIESEEFDPEDVRFPTSSATDSSAPGSSSNDNADDERPSSASFDPKSAPRPQPSASQILRYRRRCAPVLLASSPRVSDVVFTQGKRARINVKEHILTGYNSHPPRYDVHNFPKSKRPAKIVVSEEAVVPAAGQD